MVPMAQISPPHILLCLINYLKIRTPDPLSTFVPANTNICITFVQRRSHTWALLSCRCEKKILLSSRYLFSRCDIKYLLNMTALKYLCINHGTIPMSWAYGHCNFSILSSRGSTLDVRIWRPNPLTAKLFNLNFHPHEVVSRWRDPQLQVSENYSDLTKWGQLFSNIADWSHIVYLTCSKGAT